MNFYCNPKNLFSSLWGWLFVFIQHPEVHLGWSAAWSIQNMFQSIFLPQSVCSTNTVKNDFLKAWECEISWCVRNDIIWASCSLANWPTHQSLSYPEGLTKKSGEVPALNQVQPRFRPGLSSFWRDKRLPWAAGRSISAVDLTYLSAVSLNVSLKWQKRNF